MFLSYTLVCLLLASWIKLQDDEAASGHCRQARPRRDCTPSGGGRGGLGLLLLPLMDFGPPLEATAPTSTANVLLRHDKFACYYRRYITSWKLFHQTSHHLHTQLTHIAKRTSPVVFQFQSRKMWNVGIHLQVRGAQ